MRTNEEEIRTAMQSLARLAEPLARLTLGAVQSMEAIRDAWLAPTRAEMEMRRRASLSQADDRPLVGSSCCDASTSGYEEKLLRLQRQNKDKRFVVQRTSPLGGGWIGLLSHQYDSLPLAVGNARDVQSMHDVACRVVDLSAGCVVWPPAVEGEKA